MKSDKLPDVTMCGDLCQRGKLSWPRRHCAISGHHLCVYKSERDNKPILVVSLPGYDALYLEKDNKRSHVIRLSQPAHTTYWFCASTSDSAHSWVEVRCTTHWLRCTMHWFCASISDSAHSWVEVRCTTHWLRCTMHWFCASISDSAHSWVEVRCTTHWLRCTGSLPAVVIVRTAGWR